MASISKADTDQQYYLTSDLEWIVEPSPTEPGILAPKSEVIPLGDTYAVAKVTLQMREARKFFGYDD